MKNIVVSLFDVSGVMVKPWLDAGFECYIVDAQHPEAHSVEGGLHRVNYDLRKPFDFHIDKDSIAFVAAFPPCTHLAVSGARWFKGKGLRLLAESIEMFATAAEFCEASGAPYLIENPVSTISTYWRKPDYTCNPYQFTRYAPEDNYTKKTCLWTGGGFVMPLEERMAGLPSPDNRIHVAP